MAKIINPVILTEIRKEDGAQRWLSGMKGGIVDVHWLTGINAAANVHPGVVGKLEYRATASQGLHWYIPDPALSVVGSNLCNYGEELGLQGDEIYLSALLQIKIGMLHVEKGRIESLVKYFQAMGWAD